ncbi:winged helix-turn-helix domain-containing protein [Novosphingobium pentaromativorans]|uniref:Two-component system, OmpR family, response regulator n=1 Tax=Novosphingobium pentaromativorans US6-1 TaxID=1088721 RepID=G6EDI0_9SPHN|nr:two-component system, OmpR family, response regulator [Novosphingobium pentaromativorans US6-1]
MRHTREFVTRTMLLEPVWDFNFDPQTKIVETHMNRLRSKLNEADCRTLSRPCAA